MTTWAVEKNGLWWKIIADGKCMVTCTSEAGANVLLRHIKEVDKSSELFELAKEGKEGE